MSNANFKNYKNLAQLFRDSIQTYKNEKSFLTKNSKGVFEGPTYGELYEDALSLASYLIEKCGLKEQENVAIIADNRLEWIKTDLAVLFSGAADVPRGSDATVQDLEYILSHADCRIVFIENQNVLKKLNSIKDKLPKLEFIILIEGTPEIFKEGKILSFRKILEEGSRLSKQKVLSRIDKIESDDLLTLIYTSGTTGNPKGVMLTHANILSQIRNIPLGLQKEDKILSILPVWHIFERIFEIGSIAFGCKTYYTNIRSLKEDLQIVKPTFMASAPRLWESIFQGIQSKLQAMEGLSKFLLLTALRTNRIRYKHSSNLKNLKLKMIPESRPVSFFKKLYSFIIFSIVIFPAKLLDKIVLKKVRQATGGNLKASVSGGGALPQHVDELFNAIGIPVLEGYGLTETSPILAMRTPDELIVGTVGRIFPQTEIRIVDITTGKDIYPSSNPFGKKGELIVKGPQVMKGYYKNLEATEKVLQDGWFKTGDLAVFTANSCLKIVGRIKETIVLSNGENLEPVPIEAKLQESPLIESCMVVGQDKKFPGVLVVPNFQNLKEYGADLGEVCKHPEVKTLIRSEISKMISDQNGFKSFERIGGFSLLDRSWEKGEELTAKLSLKRFLITEKYSKQIDQIYENGK
ncbi:AMP-dependent synthetase/ligase [Leptospira adleri]|uniref:Long-chain fatty acid--CoA ligase n=1 Tax=Leptospira adleri TaxID=2023186 RepID=A0A2M9YSF9_9LEPT|nr:long-chain fatty acid--CoA ligase [Leptospira adleri]PJZ54454.1 long-chain fatty acid--CoA ligase [Leptospira adleri]PJZ61306.1 long-chain fatty acid--CoA ligase [Leptospira adleri]